MFDKKNLDPSAKGTVLVLRAGIFFEKNSGCDVIFFFSKKFRGRRFFSTNELFLKTNCNL